MFPCSEVLKGVETDITPPDPRCRFRAYASMDDGARDYLVRLRAEFRGAWPAVLAGDPKLFAHLLKVGDFYTADEAIYTAGLVRCYRQCDHAIPAAAAPTLPEVPDPLSIVPPPPEVGQPTPPEDV